MTYDEGSFGGAEIAAYAGCFRMDQIPVPGAQLEITVASPFCCKVGDSFWLFSETDEIIQARLLCILSLETYEAKIQIEILQIINAKAFVQAVSEEEKNWLLEKHSYDYLGPEGDGFEPQISREDEHTICLYNCYGGGDANFYDYIYTDKDGIDHLYMKDCSDFEGNYVFLGDEVLGFQKDSPYQWENGLLINWRSKTVIQCAKDAAHIVIPEGITQLTQYSIYNCPNLKTVTIPDSVTRVYHAFSNCLNLEEVILTGNSRLADSDFSGIGKAQIRRMP